MACKYIFGILSFTRVNCVNSVTSKKLPNVYESCPKRMKDFENFTKLPKWVGNFGKIMVAPGFEKLPIV